MRRHAIKPRSKVITTKHEKNIETKEDEVVFLPALHRLMGQWEILHDHKAIYPGVNQHAKIDAFNRIATRATLTQQKSMRVLDHNITDLL